MAGLTDPYHYAKPTAVHRIIFLWCDSSQIDTFDKSEPYRGSTRLLRRDDLVQLLLQLGQNFVVTECP
jgi:hypothetical protein